MKKLIKKLLPVMLFIVIFNASFGNNAILTFDDLPSNKNLEQVLDVLKKHNTKAIFFIPGAQIEDKKNHSAIMRLINEGHMIGNHGYQHVYQNRNDAIFIDFNMYLGNQSIERMSGYNPKLYRPPYGYINYEVVDSVRFHNLKILLWDIDSGDWNLDIPSHKIVENVLGNVRPDSSNIVIFHVLKEKDKRTIDALKVIIPMLIHNGYTLEVGESTLWGTKDGHLK